MSLIAKNNQKEFIPLEAGTHLGRVCGIIHIGTLTDNIQGKDVTRNRVQISFEIPEALKEDGKPHTISQEFTLSMHKQGNLLPFIESMLGKKLDKEETKEFDVSTLIGQTAMVNVIHSAPNAEGMVWANIKSVSPLPKKTEAPAPVIEPYKFDYEENFKPEFVFAMNEKNYLRKKILRSEEWIAKGIAVPESAQDSVKKF
jgi:hypothetical protein